MRRFLISQTIWLVWIFWDAVGGIPWILISIIVTAFWALAECKLWSSGLFSLYHLIFIVTLWGRYYYLILFLRGQSLRTENIQNNIATKWQTPNMTSSKATVWLLLPTVSSDAMGSSWTKSSNCLHIPFVNKKRIS